MIGTVDPRFHAVGEALRASVASGEDLGAQVAAFIDGENVIDLADGFQDRAKTLPYATDTLTCVYSSGKAVCAALILAAVSEGKLDYEQKVSEIWPEFVGGGKEDLTLAQVLSHQSGLSAFLEERDPALWIDWDRTASDLAAMEPIFPPGTASAYGPQTFGFLVGEVYRRAMGKTIGAALRGLTRDVVCGLSLSDATRGAPLVKPKRPPDLGPITPIKRAAFLEKWSAPAGVSKQAWAGAELPASILHASAHGLAQAMQLFASGTWAGKLGASDHAREQAWAERIAGDDLVLPFNLSWGAGVFRENGGLFGAPPTAIGHYGFGGSCVLADPARGVSFAYVPNLQSSHLVADPRAVRLIETLYAAL